MLNNKYLSNIFFPIFILVAGALEFTSCEESRGTLPEYPVREKTLLVYMVANNDLSSNAIYNFQEMQNGYVPTKEEGNIVVYYHIPKKNPLLLNIFKDSNGEVKVDTAYRFPASNSATKEALSSAMKVTATLFPANENGIIFWSHGTGWLPEGYYSNPSQFSSNALMKYNDAYSVTQESADLYADKIKMVREINSSADVKSFGSDSGIEMELSELKSALPYKVSYMIFDACLMGGIEVAYELKDSTDYIIFSPAEVMSTGFPYSKIMKHIFEGPTNLEAVAKEYFDYYDALIGTDRSATVSLVKTSQLEELASVTKTIFDSNRDKIHNVNTSNIQRYFRGNKHWFYDLKDFVSRVANSEQMAQFNSSLNNAVIYKASTPYFIDISIVNYSGLSTYVPVPTNNVLDSYYKALEWNKACGMIE